MRAIIKITSFVFAILATVMLMTGCKEHTSRIYKVGVSQCSGGQWREKVNSEILAAQHLYDEDVEVSLVNAHDNVDLQIFQIDSLVDSGIDLLVVAPSESAPIADAIGRIMNKGIPVIFFDRKAETDDYTAFIGGNNIEAGWTVGNYALSLAKNITNHKPVVMEITAAMNTSPACERHKGFESAIQGETWIDYICMNGDWTSNETCRLLTAQIKKGVIPDIVFCHNDGMATGAYKAIIECGKEGSVALIGIDGLPDEGIEYVKLGHQIGTYVYPTHGEEIIKLALNILTGKQYEKDNELSGMMVTPANVELIGMNGRELMRQNENMITIHEKLEEYFGLYNIQHKLLVFSFVVIGLLFIAMIISWLSYVQMKKNTRQRQMMNEEQTLFYTDASNRRVHQMFITPEEELPAPRSQDMLFAERLNEAILKNMSNSNLKMDDLGAELGLGRVQLYRKVKALTGQTPVELLRAMRLQRAYVLLTSTTKTIAEIAFEVGFNTPGYFSKCFKEQYGKLPLTLREGIAEEK